jgi:hypothetical protein
VCDLYVVGGSFQGYCTAPIGSSNSCSTSGADPNCRTGICADNGGHECLVPCVPGQSGSCQGGSQKCSMISTPTTIEGQATASQYACFPD